MYNKVPNLHEGIYSVKVSIKFSNSNNCNDNINNNLLLISASKLEVKGNPDITSIYNNNKTTKSISSNLSNTNNFIENALLDNNYKQSIYNSNSNIYGLNVTFNLFNNNINNNNNIDNSTSINNNNNNSNNSISSFKKEEKENKELKYFICNDEVNSKIKEKFNNLSEYLSFFKGEYTSKNVIKELHKKCFIKIENISLLSDNTVLSKLDYFVTEMKKINKEFINCLTDKDNIGYSLIHYLIIKDYVKSIKYLVDIDTDRFLSIKTNNENYNLFELASVRWKINSLILLTSLNHSIIDINTIKNSLNLAIEYSNFQENKNLEVLYMLLKQLKIEFTIEEATDKLMKLINHNAKVENSTDSSNNNNIKDNGNNNLIFNLSNNLNNNTSLIYNSVINKIESVEECITNTKSNIIYDKEVLCNKANINKNLDYSMLSLNDKVIQNELEYNMNKQINNEDYKIKSLQRFIRTKLKTIKFKYLKQATITIQRKLKATISRKKFINVKKAIIILQKKFREKFYKKINESINK